MFLSIYCRNIYVWTLGYEVVCACGLEFLKTFLRIFGSFIKRQTSGTSNDNEWQRVTTSNTTSGNNDNGWQRVEEQIKTNESE